MPILDKMNEIEVEKYNEYIKNRGEVSALQDLNWAKVKTDWTQEAVYLERNGEIIAAMSLLIRKLAKGLTMIYAPKGPACDIYDVNLVEELLNEAKPLISKYKAFTLKMDPEVKYDKKLEQVYRAKGFYVNNTNVDSYTLIQPIYNMILNLEGRTQEEVFKGFSEKTRYNIRVAQKKNITIRYSRDEKDLEVFYDLFKVTGARDHIAIRSYDYFRRMLNAYEGEHLRIYIAEHEGQALAAAIAINYGGKMLYIYGASSNEKRNHMPNYLMQYEMINWAIDSGCTEYDFGGVFKLTKENGLYKFKEGFCRQEGVTQFIGEIGKVYSKPKYFIFTRLMPIAKKIGNFISILRNK